MILERGFPLNSFSGCLAGRGGPLLLTQSAMGIPDIYLSTGEKVRYEERKGSMKTKTTLFISTVLLIGLATGCDNGDADIDTVESDLEVVPSTKGDIEDLDTDIEGAQENFPFAVVEISDGHKLRFFHVEDDGVIVEESAQDPSDAAVLRPEVSPLELYWQFTGDDVTVPLELSENYSRHVGDLGEFYDVAPARGSAISGEASSADEITAPPVGPQESKWWWGGGCIPNDDYNYANCLDRLVSGSSESHYMRTDGPILYSILRDTVDTNRDVKLYYKSTSGTCAWSNYHQIATGSWATNQYTGSGNWTWRAVIAGGCGGTCYEYRSIYFYDATQTSTCIPPIG